MAIVFIKDNHVFLLKQLRYIQKRIPGGRIKNKHTSRISRYKEGKIMIYVYIRYERAYNTYKPTLPRVCILRLYSRINNLTTL